MYQVECGFNSPPATIFKSLMYLVLHVLSETAEAVFEPFKQCVLWPSFSAVDMPISLAGFLALIDMGVGKAFVHAHLKGNSFQQALDATVHAKGQ
eukprot:3672193-Amphidinium_carterae.1